MEAPCAAATRCRRLPSATAAGTVQMKQNQPARSQQTTGQRSNRQQRPRTGWLQLLSAAGVSERQLMSVCRVRCRLRRASTPDHFTNSLDCRCWAGSSRDVGTGRTVSLGRAGSGWDDQNAGRLLAARLGSLGVAAGQQLTTPSRQLPAAHQPQPTAASSSSADQQLSAPP